MSLPERMERKIAKLERNIEKKQKQIEKLRVECEKHMILDYDFISEKKHIEEKIKAMTLKVKVLRDEIAEKKKRGKEKNGKKGRKLFLNGAKNMKILKLKEVK